MAIKQQLWHTWVAKGKPGEKTTARQARMLAGIAPIILAIGVGFYVLAVR